MSTEENDQNVYTFIWHGNESDTSKSGMKFANWSTERIYYR